jgi:hypothetical protein
MFLLAGVFFAAAVNGWRHDERLNRWLPQLFIGCWIIWVPLFYLLGYYVFVLWPPHCVDPAEKEYNLHKLEFASEVGRNFWIAVSAVMGAYLYGPESFRTLIGGSREE